LPITSGCEKTSFSQPIKKKDSLKFYSKAIHRITAEHFFRQLILFDFQSKL
jgi:hypothetical protein